MIEAVIVRTNGYFGEKNILKIKSIWFLFESKKAASIYEWIDANREDKTLIFLLALIFGLYLFHWITYESQVFIKRRV